MRPGALIATGVVVVSMTGATYLGCDSSPGKPASSPVAAARSGTDTAVDRSQPPLASAAYYRLDLGTTACTIGATCKATFVVTALADYHVNPEYPTKFVPAGASPLGVAAGSFAIEGEHRGVMTVELHPTAAGSYTLEGKLKLSVCNAENCQIESTKIAIPIVAT